METLEDYDVKVLICWELCCLMMYLVLLLTLFQWPFHLQDSRILKLLLTKKSNKSQIISRPLQLREAVTDVPLLKFVSS